MVERPVRVQRRRTKGWRLPENTVVVDRTSWWGNPFTVKAATEAGYTNGQQMAVEGFRRWLARDPLYSRGEPDAQREFILANIGSLRGQNLACFCRLDQPCHADVLLELANATPSRDHPHTGEGRS